MRPFAWLVVLLALALTLSEVSVSAADPAVPLPELPKGAGVLDADPPRRSRRPPQVCSTASSAREPA